MGVLSLFAFAFLVSTGQAAQTTTADTLGQQRLQFYQAISSQISPSIKARTYMKASDYFDTDWRANDDSVNGETFIFPAGHSDRLYVFGVNPGWNAEQNIVYQSLSCFAEVKGTYLPVWTIDWRESQNAAEPAGVTGLAKLVRFDPQRIDNKFVRDELMRVRGYVLYRRSDTSKPWISEFYDDQVARVGSTSGDDKAVYTFNTLAEEQDYVSHHSS